MRAVDGEEGRSRGSQENVLCADCWAAELIGRMVGEPNADDQGARVICLFFFSLVCSSCLKRMCVVLLPRKLGFSNKLGNSQQVSPKHRELLR